MQAKTISVLTSSQCNLNCSFCFLHKHEALNKYDQIIIQAWEEKTYLKNVYNALKILGEDPNQITQVNFWGGETLLHIDLIQENLLEFFKYFPNLERFSISTNWTINIEKYFNFIKELNSIAPRKIIINNQCSIDGPPGPISDAGHNGWDLYLKNYKLFTDLCNTTKLSNIELYLVINAVVDKKIYLNDFCQYDKMKDYMAYMDNFLKQIEQMCISASLFVQKRFILPGYSYPYEATVEDGLNFCKIIRLWEYVRANEFPQYNTYFTSDTDFYNGITSFNFVGDWQYNNAECCEQKTALTFLPDGRQVECSSSYIESDPDYRQECLDMGDKDRYYSSLIHHTNSINPLTASEDELNNYNWAVRTGYRNTEMTYLHFMVEMCKELALAGQIPKKYYYDEELLINHLLAIPGVINCSRENINTTMNVFLPNITTFRLFLNGTIEYLYDNHLIEYRLKGGYYD